MLGTGVRLDRFTVADGIDGWIAEARRCAGHRTAVTSDRIEVGAQLLGETVMVTARGGRRTVGSGVLHHVSPAEPWGVSYRATDGVSLGVGLTFDPRCFGGDDEADRELRVADPTFARDPALLALLTDIAESRAQGTTLDASAIRAALLSFVARRCDLSARDPVVAARKTLEAHFDRPLYLRHVADEVGMRETTFLRRFARRYGLTPIQYRLHVRLTRAGRAAWSEPATSLGEIAERTGFSELPYFHRAYRRFFGASPGVHRRGCGASGAAGTFVPSYDLVLLYETPGRICCVPSGCT